MADRSEQHATDGAPKRWKVVLLNNVEVVVGLPDEENDHCETGNVGGLIGPVSRCVNRKIAFVKKRAHQAQDINGDVHPERRN